MSSKGMLPSGLGLSDKWTVLKWISIRFAAPPVGSLRWQAPQPPASNRSGTISATSYAPTCPQAPPAYPPVHPVVQTGASEDCLFLNVRFLLPQMPDAKADTALKGLEPE